MKNDNNYKEPLPPTLPPKNHNTILPARPSAPHIPRRNQNHTAPERPPKNPLYQSIPCPSRSRNIEPTHVSLNDLAIASNKKNKFPSH